ncbi:discoidin domain-containing protein [Promicromonospora panici]|uniref:discoidin domain-containing protein n=1 Tax=Promicromonospora panici TaxID=2219658 RepID=UPI00101C82D6|nr:discoidin domain-containing protein [Promicromonospora panici]
MRQHTSRLRSRAAALLTTAAVVVAGLVPAPAAAAGDAGQAELLAGQAVEIHETTSAAGFAHPGVGLTADNLENMRTQVHAGVEPWASYYDAMLQTRFAAVDFKASIQGPTDEQPTATAYNTASMRSRQHADSIGAMTQALQYVVTGDERYRANALHVIRTWSSLDPAKFQYFPDAHIHTGVPLYQTLVAAEIIRSTEPVNDELDGYDLRWTERDEQRIEDNLVRPVLDTFLFSQNRLWNQHLYGVIGMVSAAIFLDDAELYAERVEWFTVNEGYESEHTINGGDVNGSLASLFRVIDSGDPLNPYGKDFVQHVEMGRDQAHAEGDVDLLVALARIVNNQGTRIDPVDGTVSTTADAVSPYEFLDNRILEGGDVFAAFMMGEEPPYIDTSGGAGKLSEAYRGRLREPLNELYYQYKYVADVDVEQEAPYVAELYRHGDGPLYRYGNGVSNFWNESGSDFTGAEYWVAFPPELAQEDVTVPPVGDGAELPLEKFGHILGKGAKHLTDDAGQSLVRLNATKSDAQVAVRRVVYRDRSSKALVGVRVRTQGTATLEVSRTSYDEPFTTVQLPDTGGQWRYAWFDVAAAKVPNAGANLVVLRATADRTYVDVAGLLADANGTLAPPTFGDGASLDVVAVAGEPYTRDLGVTDPDGDFSLRLQDAPRGAKVSADGTFTWTPDGQAAERVVVVASDDKADTALPVSLTIAPDRAGAVSTLLDGLQEQAAYTTASWTPVAAAQKAALDAVDGATPAEFGVLLEELRLAVAGLELLDPRLPDGTLDFSRTVSSAQITPNTLLALTDGDSQSTWGDLRIPSVVLDFGPGYRVRADAFGFLARDTFPNRAEGTNVYGSSDGEAWTLLTEHPNAGDDTNIEQVAVREAERDSTFRYLKLQIDEPGVPTDPAYPAVIWTLADFRIDGERTETGLDVLLAEAEAADLSGWSRGSVVLFTREIEAVHAAAAEPDADEKALAQRVLAAWDLLERPAPELASVPREWVTASTPSWDGSKDAAANGWAMFDGDPATFTDTKVASGWVQVVPDDGTTFHVEAVRYLPRSTHVSRAEGVQFQKSADGGQTWQTFATISGATAGWNQIDLPEPVDAGAIRVLATSGNTNLAEVALVTSTVDRTGLDLYLAETAELVAEDWTPESWQRLTAARDAGLALRGDDADPGQAEVDAATDELAAAVAALEPA